MVLLRVALKQRSGLHVTDAIISKFEVGWKGAWWRLPSAAFQLHDVPLWVINRHDWLNEGASALPLKADILGGG
jgi:hypothetical protein